MGITLFDDAVLSDIPEVDISNLVENTTEETTTYSAENLTIPDLTNNNVLNGDGPKPVQPPPLIQYTITPLNSGTGKMVTFYLNIATLSDIIINQFVILSDVLVKPGDVLFVHMNSIVEAPDAYVLNNAIRACRAKAKIACNPYVLNTAAVYPMLACQYIMPCKFGIMKFDAASVIAGGAGHIDAKNALEFDTTRKLNMLLAASKAGFIPQEKLNYIVEKQGSYAIYGQELYNAIRMFNASHSTRQ